MNDEAKLGLLLGSLLLGSACSGGESDDPAFDARMRIAGAQFVRGATPAAQDGPDVAGVLLPTNSIWPGFPNKAMQGTLAESATAAAVALSADIGYWVVLADVPDVSAPTLPTFRATASFSSALTEGAYTLEVRAVDAQQRFGRPFRQTLTSLAAAPGRVVSGALVVALSWDTESDVDLHVVDPLGKEIFHGARTSTSSPSTRADEGPGVLDADSNGDCTIDGRRAESVSWAENPPSGHYLVRIDTPSLCAAASAHWIVSVQLDDVLIARASGLALESDTWGAHDRGAGILALGFDVP